MIIGVVGTFAAGKTTVVDLLRKRGFKTLSLSDFLRERARARRIKLDRDTLLSLGNEMRMKFGPAALMQEAFNRMDRSPGEYALDAVRNAAEVEMLRTQDDAFVIGVDADRKLRFERAAARQAKTGRDENAASVEEFLAQEERENARDPHRPQLRKVLEGADVRIMNDGTLAELEAQVDSALERIKAKQLAAQRDA